MAATKYTADIVLDASCDYLKNNITEMYVCSGSSSPTTRAEAISAALASKTGLTSGSFTGPADGTTSGRKLTKNAESGISVTAPGTQSCIALCSGTTLLSVCLANAKTFEAGDKVDVPAFVVSEISDPT